MYVFNVIHFIGIIIFLEEYELYILRVIIINYKALNKYPHTKILLTAVLS